jgi:ubiquinone/menaquinone biosynthesis C-methylase UbiE
MVRPGRSDFNEGAGVVKEIPLTLNVKRDDVAAAYAAGEERNVAGFSEHMSWRDLAGQYDSCRITFDFSNGIDELLVGPIEIFREKPRSLEDRHSYKEVWDTLADGAGGAMLAVAGFDNIEEYLESGRSTADTLCLRLDIKPEDVVLEIGCGTARIGQALAPRCKKWIGTDISANMLERAKENVAQFNNVELVELTGCDLSKFEEESIDKLYCSVVFMHLDEWDRYRYVTEAFRVLRPGGRVYIDNLDLESPEGWAFFEKMALHDPLKRPANISKTSTDKELLTYLRQAGFVDLESNHSGQFVEAIGNKPAQ